MGGLKQTIRGRDDRSEKNGLWKISLRESRMGVVPRRKGLCWSAKNWKGKVERAKCYSQVKTGVSTYPEALGPRMGERKIKGSMIGTNKRRDSDIALPPGSKEPSEAGKDGGRCKM